MTVSATRIAATISVVLGASAINVGDSTQASATISDKFGRVLWGKQPSSWSSDSAAVATVSSKGKVVGKRAGTSRIVARYGNVIGGAAITVGKPQPPQPPAPPKVASIAVTLAASTLEVGKTTTASVILRDSSNNVLTGRTVTWKSSNVAIATVDSTAKVTAAGAGTANIVATSEGATGQAAIQVTAAPPPPPPPPTSDAAFWRDDFETDRLSSYFEVSTANGSLARVAGVGRNGSYGLRARFGAGQVDAGSLKLAFGRTPSTYFKPVDGGTRNYRELYWRIYIKNGQGWTGGGDKFTRATIFAGSNWAEAMIAHDWSGTGSEAGYMVIDPASGTDATGNLKTTGYNDFANLRWLGAARSTTAMLDQAHSGQWYCVETHVRLNTAGQSDGVFELRINGALEASRTGLNWVGNYSAYGLNAILLENYWNAGSPVAQERYFDDFVVSEQPIGCDASAPVPPQPPPAPVATKVAIATQPSSATTSGVVLAQQPVVQLRDASNLAVAQSGVVVSAAIGSGGGTLGGNVTATTNSSGVASFSNLSISGTDGPRTLTFSAPRLTSVTSSTISVTTPPPAPAPAATKVSITTQPSSSAISGTVFAQQPVVQLRDDANNAIAKSGVAVTVAIASGGGTLGGTLTATTNSSGVASFSGLSITGSAGTRTLNFSATGLAGATSNAISVSVASNQVVPLIEEDFSTYTSTASLLSDPRNIWNNGAGTNVALDLGVGYGSSTKSMRYDWPNLGVTCKDYEVRPGFLTIPGNQTHVWLEYVVRFGTTFKVNFGATSCAAEYKLGVLGDISGTGRWNIPEMQTGRFAMGYPGNDAGYNANFSTASLWDGKPHVFRVEAKLSPSGNTGIFKMWLDGVLITNVSGFNTDPSHKSINIFGPGANLNQGPNISGMQMWWHKITVYNANPGW